MSDIIRSARGTKHSVCRMSLEAVQDARGWLDYLMRAHHRGPADTWTAARDRAAKAAGIEVTYARRLWNRWQEMKDVSGGAYKALREAYVAECLKHEQAADATRARREARRNGEATVQGRLPTPVGSDLRAVGEQVCARAERPRRAPAASRADDGLGA